jgi:transcriptional regulator with XRE-family HTH domain
MTRKEIKDASTQSDAVLLDTLKTGFGLRNDAELAAFLSVTQTSIHKIRHKDARLGIKNRIVVLDKIGFLNSRQWIEKISPAFLSAKVKQWSIEKSQKQATTKLASASYQNAEFIDMVKYVFNCKSDQELGSKLGLATNTISMLRKGKTSLGDKPRLIILNEIEKFDLEKFNKAIESTDVLIEAIRSATDIQLRTPPLLDSAGSK